MVGQNFGTIASEITVVASAGTVSNVRLSSASSTVIIDLTGTPGIDDSKSVTFTVTVAGVSGTSAALFTFNGSKACVLVSCPEGSTNAGFVNKPYPANSYTTSESECCVSADFVLVETFSHSADYWLIAAQFGLSDTTVASFHCNAYDGVRSGDILVEFTVGTDTHYFRPNAGQTLCNLLQSPGNVGKLYSVDGVNFSTVSGGDSALLGSAEFYWGMVMAARSSQPDPTAFTMHVYTRTGWLTYAYFNGYMGITAKSFNSPDGVKLTGNYVTPCFAVDAAVTDFTRILMRVTMGAYVDYFNLVGDLCYTLTTVGAWYYHSANFGGPYQARNGNHRALLGGWTPYPTDTSDPLYYAGAEIDYRLYGTFWGAGGDCNGLGAEHLGTEEERCLLSNGEVNDLMLDPESLPTPDLPFGYYYEPGGCCHFTKQTSTPTVEEAPTVVTFHRPLEIDVMFAP